MRVYWTFAWVRRVCVYGLSLSCTSDNQTGFGQLNRERLRAHKHHFEGRAEVRGEVITVLYCILSLGIHDGDIVPKTHRLCVYMRIGHYNCNIEVKGNVWRVCGGKSNLGMQKFNFHFSSCDTRRNRTDIFFQMIYMHRHYLG